MLTNKTQSKELNMTKGMIAYYIMIMLLCNLPALAYFIDGMDEVAVTVGLICSNLAAVLFIVVDLFIKYIAKD